MVVHKEGGSREENCGRRTEEFDKKDIIDSPSAVILRNPKLHKRFFIVPNIKKTEGYDRFEQVSRTRNLKRTENNLSP